ncbi:MULTISPECIES: flagellar biosynthesis protein FlhF [unclassified Fusibacter]|uniref:flagellar biosynthesis protein FlhF n=1 Tax=unclassified Fusibacter TaxID=2624464 RepID=UPI00101367D2|nr:MULTISPECIES: flagellar biosynthesis protein FlhF [unclassified Fusibacter]MCK8058777.1 flagellar biosynthesis protein FlhF [Fusibacter sp. A2]NPE21851.1 flagellar biosynthesis protein FlhF [Fusibacter sp. A1]RXV61423.1 flagellar biosynthesis protein FlhF [Fusibacter sp. A1]
MNVKRYIAKDVQEAMQKVRLEMGRDAVILHTRKIKQKGLKGLFTKPLVEVVAAVDESEKQAKMASIQAALEKKKELDRIREIEEEESLKKEVKKDTGEILLLKEQMATITSMLNTVIDKVNNPSEVRVEEAVVQKNIDHPLVERLKSNDVTESVTDKIMSIAKRQITMSDKNDPAIKNAFRIIIRDMIGLPYKIEDPSDGQKVYFFVGPTGVGKTTTLAKIAAKLSLVDNKKVALVTADTYRIAAVDQLKTYSEILSIPLEVIYEPTELQPMIKKHKDKDYILVDTAGRNHKSEALEKDLSGLIGQFDTADIFLVISLTTGFKDVQSILNSYRFLNDYKLIFTKLDEAESYGNILNAKVAANKPIAFVTNGQSVPDDIAVADGEKIADLLLGDAI